MILCLQANHSVLPGIPFSRRKSGFVLILAALIEVTALTPLFQLYVRELDSEGGQVKLSQRTFKKDFHRHDYSDHVTVKANSLPRAAEQS